MCRYIRVPLTSASAAWEASNTLLISIDNAVTHFFLSVVNFQSSVKNVVSYLCVFL